MIRQELGQDVNAACGQLVVDNSKYQVGDIEDMTNRKRSDKKPIATVTVKRSRVKQDVNRNSNTNSNTNSNKKEIILRLIWTLLAVLAVRKVLLPLLIHYL